MIIPEQAVEKRAPVQGYSAGIPWSMHLRAYDAYCKKYGPQQALIEDGCRGGFGVDELDMFIPGWREELSRIGQLETQIGALRLNLAESAKEIERLRAQSLVGVQRPEDVARVTLIEMRDHLKAGWLGQRDVWVDALDAILALPHTGQPQEDTDEK